jgi:excisionase family DNA binding protein
MKDLSVDEAAQLLRVSSGTIRRWIDAGKLPATRTGRFWRIRQADVDNLAQNGRRTAAEPSGHHKPGTAGALAEYLRTHRPIASPEDLAELDRLIREGRRKSRQRAGAI